MPKQILKDIRRAIRKHYSAGEKIRMVLDGLRGDYSIAALCRRDGHSSAEACAATYQTAFRR